MRRHLKKLTLLLVIFLILTGCNFANDADNKLSENRIADIILLKIKIDEIDMQISRLIISNNKFSSNPLRFQNSNSRNQLEISELESEKEILLKKLNELNET